jgi:hypothetical protein
MAEALTGTIHKPGGAVPWAGALLKGRCVRFFTDGTFTYPAHEFTIETDPDGAFETSLATPDNGAAEWEFTLPGGELLGPVFVSAGDGPLTLEDLAAGAGSPEQQDTLLTLLQAYLRKDGGTMTGALVLAGAPTADLEAATKGYVDAAGAAPVDSVFGRTGAVVAAASDYDADQVDFTPAGGIAATDVQAAIEELDSEKAAGVHAHNVVTDLTTTLVPDGNAYLHASGGGVDYHGVVTVMSNIGAAAARPGDVDIAGTSHTFELTDEGASVRSQSGSATVFTVPLNSAVAFPVGVIIGWAQKGAGELSIAATGGVTINSLNGNLKAAGQHAEGALRKTDTNVWDLVGALKA